MKRFFIYYLLTLLALFTGCNKKEEPTPEKGNIIGLINLIDLDGKVIDDRSGVIVTVNHASDSAISDANGKYELNDIDPGTISIVFEKKGFGTKKLYNIENPGGYFPVVPPRISLYQQPNFKISNILVDNNDQYIVIEGTIPPVTRFDLLTVMSGSLDDSNIDFDYYQWDTWDTLRVAEAFTSFNVQYIKRTDFYRGQKIYIRLYIKNTFESTKFYDAELKKTYYTSPVPGAEVIPYDIQ